MADIYLPGADQDRRFRENAMSGNTASRRCVLHTTENQVGTAPQGIATYMGEHGGWSSGYHLLVPMESGHRPLQLHPANRKAGSLRNEGGNPNGQGTILIQISFISRAADNPLLHGGGPWWPGILEWLDSWGVPRQWFGPEPVNGLHPMDMGTWNSGASGYCAHSTVPSGHNASRHTDPGRINFGLLFPTQPAKRRDPDMILVQRTNGEVHLVGIDAPAYVATPEDLAELSQALTDPAHLAKISEGSWENLVKAGQGR